VSPCGESYKMTDLNGAINILHIPESLRSTDRGISVVRDRGNGLKTQPVIYRWTNGMEWVETPTSYEVDEDEGGKPQTYDPS